jgi:hypothetical protein
VRDDSTEYDRDDRHPEEVPWGCPCSLFLAPLVHGPISGLSWKKAVPMIL